MNLNIQPDRYAYILARAALTYLRHTQRINEKEYYNKDAANVSLDFLEYMNLLEDSHTLLTRNDVIRIIKSVLRKIRKNPTIFNSIHFTAYSAVRTYLFYEHSNYSRVNRYYVFAQNNTRRY